MPWETHVKTVGYGTNNADLTVAIRKPAAGGKAKVQISINDALFSKLGWQPTDKIQIDIGTDSEMGKIRLGVDPHGYATSPTKSKVPRWVISCAIWDGLPDEALEKKDAKYILDTGLLIIDLPDWRTPKSIAAGINKTPKGTNSLG
jgi:hypothetical protein